MAAPLDFPPLDVYGWENRFDDPRREYRTLYCAGARLTCLYEVLADLRPATAMLLEWARLYGSAGVEDMRLAGRITWEWRQRNALAAAWIACEGHVADLDDVALRTELSSDHADLLVEHGMPHLDVSEIRSKARQVTKTVGRWLYEHGYAGVRFRSNLDDRECFALFEGRASLEGIGEPEPLTGDLPELLQAASDFELIVKRVWGR